MTERAHFTGQELLDIAASAERSLRLAGLWTKEEKPGRDELIFRLGMLAGIATRVPELVRDALGDNLPAT